MTETTIQDKSLNDFKESVESLIRYLRGDCRINGTTYSIFDETYFKQAAKILFRHYSSAGSIGEGNEEIFQKGCQMIFGFWGDYKNYDNYARYGIEALERITTLIDELKDAMPSEKSNMEECSSRIKTIFLQQAVKGRWKQRNELHFFVNGKEITLTTAYRMLWEISTYLGNIVARMAAAKIAAANKKEGFMLKVLNSDVSMAKREYTLQKQEIKIGKAGFNDIIIPSVYVSKKHATLTRDNGTYRIRDEQSSNGTIVNGSIITEKVLNPDDLIQIGNTVFNFNSQTHKKPIIPEGPFPQNIFAEWRSGKYALISDVHSNLEALNALLEKIRQEGYDGVFCLGDVVGYGPDPVECAKILNGLNIPIILGNHDAAFFRIIPTTFFNDTAKATLDFATDQFIKLSKEEPDTYQRLMNKFSLTQGRIYSFGRSATTGFGLFHAMPMDKPDERCYTEYMLPTGYLRKPVYQDPAFFTQGLFKQAPVIFIGHTHMPLGFTYKWKNDNGRAEWDISRCEKIEMPENLHMELDTEQMYYVINVGSAGQPRDNNNKACYCELIISNDGSMAVRMVRVQYNYEATIEKINARGLPKKCGERLREGR